MLEILGVHSSAKGGDSRTDGHAWLSMHFSNGRQTTIGLWTTTLFTPKAFIKDPTGVFLDETFDVNFGLEAQRHYMAKASRYYRLDAVQGKRAVALLGQFQSWRFTNTCASWARRVVRELLGEDLGSAELGGATDTPRALGDAILRLEATDPTSLQRPKRTNRNAVANALFNSERAV
jgi:hypothetical protein